VLVHKPLVDSRLTRLGWHLRRNNLREAYFIASFTLGLSVGCHLNRSGSQQAGKQYLRQPSYRQFAEPATVEFLGFLGTLEPVLTAASLLTFYCTNDGRKWSFLDRRRSFSGFCDEQKPSQSAAPQTSFHFSCVRRPTSKTRITDGTSTAEPHQPPAWPGVGRQRPSTPLSRIRAWRFAIPSTLGIRPSSFTSSPTAAVFERTA
jgi:hypothetical protein